MDEWCIAYSDMQNRYILSLEFHRNSVDSLLQKSFPCELHFLPLLDCPLSAWQPLVCPHTELPASTLPRFVNMGPNNKPIVSRVVSPELKTKVLTNYSVLMHSSLVLSVNVRYLSQAKPYHPPPHKILCYV
jgi:hypothetical protein